MPITKIKFFKTKAIYQLTDAPIVAFIFGETGYYAITVNAKIEDLNLPGVTEQILESAEFGSMFGWDKEPAKLASDFAKTVLEQISSS